MKNIDHINGLTEETADQKRIVRYNGEVCERINREENLVENDTSYRGCVINSWETYQTPVGIVERHYWARGAGLERSGVDWRIIPVAEVAEAQKRFEMASRELAEARSALEMLMAVPA